LLLIALLAGCSSSPPGEESAPTDRAARKEAKQALRAEKIAKRDAKWAEREAKAVPADKAARIRLFGVQMVGLKLYRNSICNKGKAQTVSGGTGGAFKSAFGSGRNNLSMGMPETPNVRNIAERDGRLVKAFFREYVVEAEQPLTLEASYSDSAGSAGTGPFSISIGSGSVQCRAIVSTFFPEAGKDYEASLDLEPDGCALHINQILVQDDNVTLLPVELSDSCQ
jgi:hypothetical protein